jgi:hypothetical protein
MKTIVNAAGAVEISDVCVWDSNLGGSGATAATKATKTCRHDLAAGAFYHFEVGIWGGAGTFAQFYGIDFPA